MDQVENALQALERQQKAPVEDAKKGLAPTRAAAQQALQDAKTHAANYAPRWQVMRARAIRAVRALGVETLPNSLDEYFRQAFGDAQARIGLVKGAAQSFEEIIRQIDELSEWDFVQGIHHRLPGNLQAKLANLGALEALDRKIEQEVKTLENAAVEKAGS